MQWLAWERTGSEHWIVPILTTIARRPSNNVLMRRRISEPSWPLSDQHPLFSMQQFQELTLDFPRMRTDENIANPMIQHVYRGAQNIKFMTLHVDVN